jgi:flagellar basal-body rod protein FlgF
VAIGLQRSLLRGANLNSGSYAACTGLKAQDEALELIAHNLANLNTTGYRGQQPVFESLLTRSPNPNPVTAAINNFGVMSGARVDRSAGNLEQTANPLDLGIEGPGFFAVQTSRGMLYTRNGSFQISAKGHLVTAAGDEVLGDSGPITIPSAGNVSVSGDGTVSVQGAVVGKVRLVEFPRNVAIEPAGDSYYSAPPNSSAKTTTATIRQGMLESSNVNPMAAVVSLISLQRQAEMLQRSLSVFYSEFNRIAASELPKV